MSTNSCTFKISNKKTYILVYYKKTKRTTTAKKHVYK